MKKIFSLITILSLIGFIVPDLLIAESDSFEGTVEITSFDITVAPDSYDYEIMSTSATSTSALITASGDTNVTLDLTIYGENASSSQETNWTFDTSEIDTDQYMHHFSLNGISYSSIGTVGAQEALATVLPTSYTTTFYLMLYTPSASTDLGSTFYIPVTVVATEQ